jgi:two-component system phosphate regulon sensor histidine kinase PhoR
MSEMKKVLLAISDEGVLNLLNSGILSLYQIETASTLLDVKTQIAAFDPDALLIDETLMVSGSSDLAGRLFEENPALPVILFSGADSLLTPRQVLSFGAADWFQFPFLPEEVSPAIEKALNRSKRWTSWQQKETTKVTGSLQNRVNELETIFKVGQSITSNLDLDQVLTEVVQAAVEVTGAEEGSILLPDEETGELYIRASRNFRDDFVRTFRLPVTDTYAGQVFKTGVPLFLNEMDPQKIKTAYLVYSIIYVPLIFRDQTVGVLGVDNRESQRGFDDKNLTLLQTMADYAAIAIENAKLFSQTEIERSKLETILRQVEDGVLVVGEDDRLILVNHVVRNAFGLGDQVLEGKKYSDVFSHRALLMTIRGDAPNPDRIEIRIDDQKYFRARSTPIDGVGQVITLHDISYLKELDQAKTEFVTTVSHDLRSPLTSIMGYVELIKRVGEVTDQQADYIKRVQASVYHITTMINEILELGKIENRLDKNFEMVRLIPIIEDVVTGQKPVVAERNQTLSVKLIDSLPAVYGDSIQLRQMLENLIGNAIKYTGRGGKILITGETEKDQVILRVQDTGYGIPLADQPKVFDRFYRANNVTPDTQGTGLGLAITKSIVDNHKGRIWVDSKEGEGSTFTVVLPIYE